MNNNPSHIYTLITAARGLSYVQQHYAHRPALVADFLALPSSPTSSPSKTLCSAQT